MLSDCLFVDVHRCLAVLASTAAGLQHPYHRWMCHDQVIDTFAQLMNLEHQYPGGCERPKMVDTVCEGLGQYQKW